VEVKPLTIFIGRNSVGKSLIAQTLWALAIYLSQYIIGKHIGVSPHHLIWLGIRCLVNLNLVIIYR
jgi:predicted ATPase